MFLVFYFANSEKQYQPYLELNIWKHEWTEMNLR